MNKYIHPIVNVTVNVHLHLHFSTMHPSVLNVPHPKKRQQQSIIH